MNIIKFDFNLIKLVASDCDGVLTDGGLYYTVNGDTMRRFCVLDGIGFQNLIKNGIFTAIITAENNAAIKARAEKLGVDYLIMGRSDKLEALKQLCEELEIDISNAVYIGDDVADIPVIKAAGWGVAPGSAFQQVKDAANYVTQHSGGNGAFRELSDLILGT